MKRAHLMLIMLIMLGLNSGIVSARLQGKSEEIAVSNSITEPNILSPSRLSSIETTSNKGLSTVEWAKLGALGSRDPAITAGRLVDETQVTPFSAETGTEVNPQPFFAPESSATSQRPVPPSPLQTILTEIIAIDEDADFGAAGYNFPGTGSSKTPYRIEGYSIFNSTGPLISIQNTNAYVVIQDNVLNSVNWAYNGISLVNVTHVTVQNNTLAYNRRGIDLQQSSYNLISNNEIINSSTIGIRVSASEMTTLSGNNVSLCYRNGLHILNSNSTTITNNRAFSNGWIKQNTPEANSAGIAVVSSLEADVSGNTIYDNLDKGIALENVLDATVSSNTVTNNSIGIWQNYITNATLSNNIISESFLNGIYLNSSANNLLVSNVIYNATYYNSQGIELQFSDNNTLTQNSVYENPHGIELHSSDNNILTQNTVYNHTSWGIELESSDNTTITQNTIYDNGEEGLFLIESSYSRISNNTIHNSNEEGIELYGNIAGVGSNNNTIFRNIIYSNGRDGITLYLADHNTVRDNIIYNNTLRPAVETVYELVYHRNMWGDEYYTWEYVSYDDPYGGILLERAQHNIVANNTIYNHSRGGQYGIRILDDSQYNVLSNNTVYGNREAGIKLLGRDVPYWIYICSHNTLSYNTIYSNIYYGIYLGNLALGNSITNNILSGNQNGIALLDEVENNVLSRNTINDSVTGILVSTAYSSPSFPSHNILANNIINNTISYGISLYSDILSTISNNTISHSEVGIKAYYSSHAAFFLNWISNCSSYGISLQNPVNCEATWNVLINNNPEGIRQAILESSSSNEIIQSNVFAYNYWSEWISPDTDADGIVDEPYHIEVEGGSTMVLDLFPRTNFAHQLTPPTVNYPNGGEILNNTVTIRWTAPIDSWGHLINQSVFYSADGGAAWSPLAMDLSEVGINDLSWDTTALIDGSNYLIKVVAVDSQGLTAEDTSDTLFTVGNNPHSVSAPAINHPNGGETLSGKVTIEWNGSIDAWNHPITYSVFYTADAGLTWIALTADLEETEWEWDTTTAIKSNFYLLKVVANDTVFGVLAEDISDGAFTIERESSDASGWKVPVLIASILIIVVFRKLKRIARTHPL